MFFRKTKELQSLVDESRYNISILEEKIEELTKQNKLLEHNNMILIERNNELTERIHQIDTLAHCNKYDNINTIFNKIKELTTDDEKVC